MPIITFTNSAGETLQKRLGAPRINKILKYGAKWTGNEKDFDFYYRRPAVGEDVFPGTGGFVLEGYKRGTAPADAAAPGGPAPAPAPEKDKPKPPPPVKRPRRKRKKKPLPSPTAAPGGAISPPPAMVADPPPPPEVPAGPAGPGDAITAPAGFVVSDFDPAAALEALAEILVNWDVKTFLTELTQAEINAAEADIAAAERLPLLPPAAGPQDAATMAEISRRLWLLAEKSPTIKAAAEITSRAAFYLSNLGPAPVAAETSAPAEADPPGPKKPRPRRLRRSYPPENPGGETGKPRRKPAPAGPGTAGPAPWEVDEAEKERVFETLAREMPEYLRQYAIILRVSDIEPHPKTVRKAAAALVEAAADMLTGATRPEALHVLLPAGNLTPDFLRALAAEITRAPGQGAFPEQAASMVEAAAAFLEKPNIWEAFPAEALASVRGARVLAGTLASADDPINPNGPLPSPAGPGGAISPPPLAVPPAAGKEGPKSKIELAQCDFCGVILTEAKFKLAYTKRSIERLCPECVRKSASRRPWWKSLLPWHWDIGTKKLING